MEKIKLLLYCTNYNRLIIKHPITNRFTILNGKIVGECNFEVEEIRRIVDEDNEPHYFYTLTLFKEKDLLSESCLTQEQLKNYLEGNRGYAIHIKNLTIFDKPRDLNCYFLEGKQVPFGEGLTLAVAKPLKRPPQNMCYVRGCNTGEKYVLISIRPKWISKILNGEKTIEVRKKVLKEMITDA